MPGSIFQMVRQVLADSQTKLAMEKQASQGQAAPARSVPRQEPTEQEKKAQMLLHSEKIAGALDAFAENLNLLEDQRTPQEKIAEYRAIQQAFQKRAEQGDEGKGPHQHEEANHDSISPMHPPMDSGVNPGGPDSAMKATPNMASGTTPEPGSQGQATEDQIPPTHISPTEHAYPTDGGNALETNLDHQPGKGGQPIDKIAQARAQALSQLVASGGIRKEAAAFIIARDQAFVKQAFGTYAGALAAGPGHRMEGAAQGFGHDVKSTLGGMGIGGALGGLAGLGLGALRGNVLGNVGLGAGVGGALGTGIGAIHGGIRGLEGGLDIRRRAQEQAPPAQHGHGESVVDDTKTAQIAAEAMRRGVPEKLASAWAKFATAGHGSGEGDEAHISAGTTPDLQAVPGVPSPLSQGSEAGQMVPDQKGHDGGRQLINDNEAAINATQGEAHGRMVRSEMARYLNEPAMSAAHDKTLQQSLDNTSSAGVKIAATRELLKKYASQSPQHRQKLAEAMAKVKKANEAMGYGSPPGADAPGASGPMPGMTNPGGASMPPPGAGGAKMAEGALPGADPAAAAGAAGVPDSALAAAAEGVTPEELAMAEAMLQQQLGAGMPPEGMPPGGEEQPAAGTAAPAAPGEGAGTPPAGAPQAA